jgi:protein-tyrosine phosphatase
MPPPSFASQLPKIHVQRLLTWNACQNVRVLGGLPLKDGGSTRWRAVARADDLCQLTVEGQLALIDHGIHTIIDLRAPTSRFPRDCIPTGPHTQEVQATSISRRPAMTPFPWPPSRPRLLSKTPMSERCSSAGRSTEPILTAIAQAPEGGEVVQLVESLLRFRIVFDRLFQFLTDIHVRPFYNESWWIS